jgi:restriction endonuclease S subunit
MKNNLKLILSFVFFLSCGAVFAQQPDVPAPDADKSADAQQGSKKVFAPKNKRDPFLSKEELQSIEAARQAEIKRRESERKRLEEEEKARREAIERQRLLEEELKKNPAREIINKIRIDGIVGKEAIINGNFKSVGDRVLGAKITKVSDTSVTFVYKGQTFVKKMPLSDGVGLL